MAITPQEWTISGLSVELGIDRRTIGKRIAGVKPIRADGKSKYYKMADVVAALFIEPGTAEKEKIDYYTERARLTKAQADEKELTVKKIEGELVPADQVANAWAKETIAFKQRLLAVPSKVAPHLIGLETAHEVSNIVRNHIKDACSDLARNPHYQFNKKALERLAKIEAAIKKAIGD